MSTPRDIGNGARLSCACGSRAPIPSSSSVSGDPDPTPSDAAPAEQSQDTQGPDEATATVDGREESPVQQAGDGDSRHGETLSYLIPCLPEDIWYHIHSLMPMRAAARAACLSRAFVRSWRSRPNLTLNLAMVGTMMCAYAEQFSWNIDAILRDHSGIGLKTLELDLDGDDRTFPYVNSWLHVVVTSGIERLSLVLYEEYNFPCSLLSDGVRNSIRELQLDSCVFRPTYELGPFKRLTSLELSSVGITGDELDCFLFNSIALEKLELYNCQEMTSLKIPYVLKHLSHLTVISCHSLQVIECKDPNLSIMDFYGKKIKLSLGQPLRMKKLCMNHPNVVVNTPMLLTKFLYMKHLSIQIRESAFSSPYDYFSLVSFLDAAPSLETLWLDVSQEDIKHQSVFEGSSYLRQLPECRHNCLKVVEIIGFNSSKSLVELTCCIVKNSVSLEVLTLDTLYGRDRCSGNANETCCPISNTVLKEASRTIVAIRMYIEEKVAPTTKLNVLEPCTRCHSNG